MLESHKKGFDKRIVEILIKLRSASALKITSELRSNGPRCSIQNVYYTLRALQNEGVIVKVKKQYTLSLIWALEIINFADRLDEKFISTAYASELLPKSGKKIVWKFSNLFKLDDFWVQAMIAAFQSSNAQTMFSSCAHPWFYFAQAKKMHIFYKLLESKGKQIKLTISGDSFLDQYFKNSVSKKLYEVIVSANPLKLKSNQYSVVIGAYYFLVTINRQSALEIDELFRSTKKLSESEYKRIFHTLNRSTTARLEIQHSVSKTKRASQTFQKFIGIK